MPDYGTNVGEKFAKNALTAFFEQAVAPMITNQDYEGEIKGGGADRVNILSFGSLALRDYTGSAMSAPDKPSESEGVMTIAQKKSYYFQIESFAKFASYVNNAESTMIQNAGRVLQETVDAYVLGKYSDVGAGNRVGTDYTTGTVTVDVTTGAVTGSGTTFASSMVGLGFKASGHSTWYRVKTYTSATAIVIEDDKDDVTSAYTGGAIGAGATYTIEASTVLTVTKSTIFAQIIALGTKLDIAKVPKSDRYLIVPSTIAGIIKQAPELIPAVATAYMSIVEQGILGKINGFTVVQSEQVAGNNTTGYYCLAVHKSWQTMAMAFTESGIEDFTGGFGKNYKGLNCYDSKIIDIRRKAGAYLYAKV